MKKIISVIFGAIVLVLIVILLPSFLGLFVKDIAPINDSDLSLQKVMVSDKDNAYFDLIKIEDVIYEPEGKSKIIFDMVNNGTWDEEVAKEIVYRNQEAFEYYSKAAHKPEFQNPTFANPENINPDIVFPSLNSWRRMARLSSIKALYLGKQGKDSDAIKEALNSVYIGQKIQESQVSLLEYLVAISMKETGLETIQKIIVSSNLNSDELKKYTQDLNQFYKNEDGLIAVCKGEYYMQSLIIDALVNGNTKISQYYSYTEEQSQDISQKLKNNYYFRQNKTKAIFAEHVREVIKNADKFCSDAQITETQKKVPSSFLKAYLTENLIGKTLHDVIVHSLFSVNKKKCEEDLLISATQTIIAIKAFKNDTGNYPASLDKLVPDYLSSVPLDYFDGKPLRYSEEKNILYSVGEDLKDAGGSVGNDWHRMPDPTFKIN